jgi:acyl-CoA synthetase (AMP-forming)/AMP-acid ligase II
MIFRGPYPDIEIPDTPLTPLVLRHTERLADKPALIDGPSGRTLTYGQLAESVRRTAAGLAVRGFRKGNVLAIVAPNSIEYVIAFHAVASLGGVVTTLNPLSTADELAFQLGDSGAAYLLTMPELLEKARAAIQGASMREVFVFGEAPGTTPFATLLDRGGATPPVSIDPRSDVAALFYSSGTTGFPKGVMLTHAALAANIEQVAVVDPMTEADTVVATLPFFHIGGVVWVVNRALHGGATAVILPRFELEPFLQALQDYAVTRAILVPPIMLALARHPLVDRYDLSRLEVIMSVAAPLSQQVAAACAQRVGCAVKQGYGLTEASPGLIVGTDDPMTNTSAIGQCLPNTECRVVNPESGAELGPGEVGEIQARGPQVMKGYFNRPEATAQAIDAEGWLRTGDLGYADEDGFFSVVDRLKELIKYKGYQVAPAELEAILLTHPAVADAAVIPSPDEEAGEVPKAFVVLKDEASAEELMLYVANRVAPHKKVRRVEFIEAIPKSPSGKILRRVLVERERAAVADPVLV